MTEKITELEKIKRNLEDEFKDDLMDRLLEWVENKKEFVVVFHLTNNQMPMCEYPSQTIMYSETYLSIISKNKDFTMFRFSDIVSVEVMDNSIESYIESLREDNE